MNRNVRPTRREFLLATAAATTSASLASIVPARVLGREGTVSPSEKITLGIVGIGPRCTYNLGAMLDFPDVRCVAIADVQASRRDADRRDGLRLAEARRFVLQHLGDPTLGPEDIALALHMSRRSLYNLFAAAGMRPRAFIQQLRLERACETLSAAGTSSGNITRIALEHGFADVSHFSRSFRERFGVSPSAYQTAASTPR